MQWQVAVSVDCLERLSHNRLCSSQLVLHRQEHAQVVVAGRHLAVLWTQRRLTHLQDGSIQQAVMALSGNEQVANSQGTVSTQAAYS